MTRTAGFTLVEIMVSLVVASLIIAGAISSYLLSKQAILADEINATLEANLRVGMDKLTFSLRNAGYGVPVGPLANWIDWVPGFAGNPLITPNTGTPPGPATLSVASCTSKPVATLANAADPSTTTITVNATNLPPAVTFDTANRKLIYIGNSEHALVRSVSGNILTIDTDPVVAGNQGLTKGYVAQTPVCRVNVVTYTVDTTNRTLLQDDNQGGGAQPVVDGITDLQIAVNAGGVKPRYRITVTGRSLQIDPLKRQFSVRSLTTTTSQRN